MSLFRQALDALQGQYDDNSDEWFDDLAGELGRLIDKTDDEFLKQGATQALDIVKSHKSSLVLLGGKGLTLFVSHVARGDTHEAQLEFIRSGASSADDLIDGMLRDAVDVAQEEVDREKAKEQALEIAKAIGTAGARFLLPLLLAAI